MRFIWPLDNHAVSRGFYYLSSIYIGGQHMGTDIPAPSGTPIKVVADGEVRGIGWDIYSGFFVAVDHAGNWTSRYRHLYGQSPVTRGQQVSQGQVIGTVGSTGWSTGPHLHLDLWNLIKQSDEAMYKAGWWAHDPEIYLGKEDDMTDAEFLARLNKLLTQARIPATLKDGKTHQSGSYALGAWLNFSRIHREDEAKHDGDGDSYTDARARKAIKERL